MPLPPLGSEEALGGSTVYAADGKTVLAVLHASQQRKPIALHPGVQGAHHRGARHRRPPFLPARRIRHPLDHPGLGRRLFRCGHPGRLDHHPATGQADLPDSPSASSPARSKRRSSPIASSASTPRIRFSRPTSTPSTSATGPTGSRPPPTCTSTSTPRSSTLPQAALLAGLIQNPSGYDPILDPAGARTRRSRCWPGWCTTATSLPPRRRPPTGSHCPPRSSSRPSAGDQISDYYVQEVQTELLGAGQPARRHLRPAVRRPCSRVA